MTQTKQPPVNPAWFIPTELLKACLGMQFVPDGEEVRFHHPRLSTFLGEVVIRGMAIGKSTFDVMLRRHNGTDLSVNVLDQKEGWSCHGGHVSVTHRKTDSTSQGAMKLLI